MITRFITWIIYKNKWEQYYWLADTYNDTLRHKLKKPEERNHD